MKVFRIALAAAALSFTAFADVASRPPVSSSNQFDRAEIARQHAQAEKDYRRGVQFADGDKRAGSTAYAR